jgi:hypothetical protein
MVYNTIKNGIGLQSSKLIFDALRNSQPSGQGLQAQKGILIGNNPKSYLNKRKKKKGKQLTPF